MHSTYIEIEWKVEWEQLVNFYLNDVEIVPKQIENFVILEDYFDYENQIYLKVAYSQTKKILVIQPRHSFELII